MAERITIDELKSYLWQSAVLLRTHIDAGAYKQYILASNICCTHMKPSEHDRQSVHHL